MTDQFDAPDPAGGVDMNDLQDSLLLIESLRIETDVQTAYGKKDATVVNIHVLDGEQANTVYLDVFLWPKVMQSQVRSNVGTGRYNLGRLTQGVAKVGQKPPWKLADPTDKDSELARAYLSKQPAAAAAAPAAADDDDCPF